MRIVQAASLSALALSLAGGSALAQTTNEQSRGETDTPQMATANTGTGEIIVTARKREETLIDVPVVVTAVGGEQLRNQGITNIDGIARVVPQLLIANQGGSVQGGNISIRGISGPDSNPFGDQAVSFNVDGVQIAKATVRRMADIDISQVEVLKGPQALFFGKNSPAGIISIRTNDPGDRFEAGLSAGYEFEAREKRVEGFVSTPLTDTLGFRLAGIYSDMKGWLRDVTPVTAPYNYQPKDSRNPNSEDWAMRGTLLFEPSSDFTARLKVNYAQTRNNGPQSTGAFISCPAGVRSTGSGIDQCSRNDGTNSNATYGTVVATIPATLNYFRADGENFQNQKQFLTSLEMNYDLSDNIRLTSVTGYYDVKLRQCQNYESDPSFILPSCNPYEGNEFSQELRLATNFDGILNFTGGAYYAKTDYETGSVTYLFGGNFDLFGPGFGGPTTPALVNNYYLRQKGTAWSAYGQVSLTPNEQFEITAGGRYSYEKKRLPLVRSGGGLGELFPSTGPTTILDESTDVPLTKTKDSWKDFSPEITVSYKPMPTLNLFASYKQGFLSGGFNSSSVSFSSAPNLDLSYDPQTIEGFEAGIKAELFDRRLFLNFAAYTYKVDDLQVTQYTNATATIRNAGSVKVEGVEADFTFRTPVDGLTLRGSAAYNNGKYSSFPNAPCYNGQPVGPEGCFLNDDGNYVQNLDGTELIRAPEWNLAASFDYETPIGDNLKFGLSGGVNHTSSYLTNASAAPQSRMPSYTLVDATVRVGTADDRWELALIGKNLTEEWVFVASPDVPFTGTSPGVVPEVLGDRFASIGRGRELMLRVSFKY